MKQLFISIIVLTCTTSLVGQTALEKAFNRINVKINFNEDLLVTTNTEMIYPYAITPENPIPTLNQAYDTEFSHGKTAINSIFGMIHAKMELKGDSCEVFIYASPGISSNRMYSKCDSTLANISQNLSFGRIKKDFRYGYPLKGVTLQEAEELNSMINHYPDSTAKKLFNANAMVSYPLNLRGNVYNGCYSRCRAVVIGRNGFEFYLYFFL